MRLNPVLGELGSYSIATLFERVAQRRADGLPVIDFTVGDPIEPTPPFIPNALRNAVPTVSQYPLTAGMPETKRAMADYLGRRFDVSVDPDTQVLITSGSKEAVFSSPLAFVDAERNDTVVFGSPSYPVYEWGARLAGAAVHQVRLSGDFVLRAEDIAHEVWQRAGLVWACSPHNPTGAVATADELGALLERARAHDAMFMSDECYVDLYEEDAFTSGPASALQVAGPDFSGMLAFYSCSKRSGMTGYRSGAIVGDADAIAALRRLRAATGTASPHFVQAAATAAWSDDTHAAERRRLFAAKRSVLRGAFERVGYRAVASRAGLYLWVAVGDDIEVTDRLLAQGVVVSPGRFFGPGGEGYLRLALVPPLEECEAAVEVVVECLA
ncbi:MAG: aminotransferase class I/II-fold pyridoxal phosphate-dependent enzyme [Acidimicrobiia bacterium]|nr:aminotransferase class I/II-fold pyridoxal phosphate-dependent enzyme [Acidimicrobiia bacterium]